jgi:6-phosphogluconolactonase
MLNRRTLLLSLPVVAAMPHSLFAFAPPRSRLLVGTGTTRPSGSKGIYVADWNSDGSIGEIALVAQVDNPTFMALGPHDRNLYAISEVDDGKVTAFHIRDGKQLTLERLNQQTADGNGPAHIALNTDGRSAFVSNYGGGSLTSYKIETSGAISAPVSQFQYKPVDEQPSHEHPHAHQATPSPDGRWLLVNDLGSDRIWVYQIEPATAKLTPAKVGFWQARLNSGPRHLVFHPNGRWVYNANELDSTVDQLLWDGKAGTLTTQGTFVSTLPPAYPAKTSFVSEIICSPDGRFVYVGNRGHETIAKFDVNPTSGALTLSQLAPHGGKTARHITLDPTGRFLLVACQVSGGIVVLPRDPSTGRLSEPSHTYPIDSPQCLLFTS